ncbi:TPA: YkgJ family cysteine cluster protein [Candidatus Berkelbacteria bacterium]|uniref:Uncharacterized protein n=1 Tax=Berkelbacteria bacterium GW2011_GWE1_39_12 TaxID=1618337 RepID=A0A0G4B4A0_9BACT|nr:MAG: hypothetical protein UT28_C0001G0630 [Berkelbacteria bacterium GW2011_GWE1_39_12]HBO61021.1 YkgJ family cysteine cluster protein [Candidatus Berkelbacteria bacterium]
MESFDRKAFELLVALTSRENGLKPIEAIYRIVDELLSETIKRGDIHLACSEGCTHCCHQLVAASDVEWQLIEKYIAEMPVEDRSILLKKMKDGYTRWQDYLSSLPDSRRQSSRQNTELMLEDWYGTYPCPFLNESSCGIYSVRPLLCRAFTSTSKCTSTNNSECVQFRFDFMRFAMDMVFDLQDGKKTIIHPLIHRCGSILTII